MIWLLGLFYLFLGAVSDSLHYSLSLEVLWRL